MFRKLVSNLAFSPALISQVSFYAKRLKQEEATRRIGLIFTALALIVQSFTVFSPPEAANAASSQDLIRGGVKNISEFLTHYDKNTNNIKDLFNAVGITRAEIQKAGSNKQVVNSKSVPYSFGMNPHFSASQGERRYDFPLARGGTGTVYYQPLSLWDTGTNVKNGSNYEMFVGQSAKAGWFAIMLRCANLGLKKPPAEIPCPAGTTGKYPNCKVPEKMCTIKGKEKLKASDPNCKEDMCTIKGKEKLKASDPGCQPDKPKEQPPVTPPPAPSPSVVCSYLNVTPSATTYYLEVKAVASNGAKITGYNYQISRDNKNIDSITLQSNEGISSTTITASTPGTYLVKAVVKSSIGDKTSTNCTKTFTIAQPSKCSVNPLLLESDPNCQPCPGDLTIWIKDSKCEAEIIMSKTSNNQTQNNVDATTTTAKAGDRITYTLKVENVGNAPETMIPEENLRDVNEYATLIDSGGGEFNEETRTITWPSITIEPKSQITRLFTVKILDEIPSTGQGVSNKTSYDCRIDNTFGNTVSIDIDCPPQKQVVEQIVSELPHTGPKDNLLVGFITLAIVVYFYMRSLQTKKEIRLIRRDLNTGAI